MLLIIESNTRLLEPLRSALATAVSPFYYIAESPYRLGDSVGEVFASRQDLIDENARLEERNLELSHVAQQTLAVQAENERLRELLGSRARLAGDVLVAELVSAIPDVGRHEVIIDKGSSDGVAVGQPVIDADGLFGQVVEVAETTSRVLLISDTRHAVPVQVVRNDTRAIAVGTGSFALLELEHVPITADVREGDVLVSSGLGGRFPVGYPVGTVISAVNDNALGFKRVMVQPSAALDRSRHVLLVFGEASE